VAQVVAEHQEPEVETIVRNVHVLPEGQAKVTGTVTSLRATDVVGPPLGAPIVLPAGGTATIENGDEAIVWTGGRPFALLGPGLDLGPTDLSIDAGGEHWTIDGPRALLPGHYEVHTAVAVGRGGLATPRDSYAFDAADDATLDAPHGVVTASSASLHLTGPGSLVLDGAFEVRTRDGRRTATHLQFGPGPLDLTVTADRSLTATLQGPLE
jgi:hypothetical protein